MLIAEDLLLLLTDDHSGKAQVDGTKLDHALAGAVLLELTLSGAVDLAGAQDSVKPGRVVIRNSGATGDGVLDEGLRRVARKAGRKPKDVVPALTKGLRAQLYEQLAGRGIVQAERDKVLGLFPRTRWPVADSEHERRIRTQLRDQLVHGVSADERTGALISLLSAIDAVSTVIDPRDAGLDKRELNNRAKAIAEGQWASEAVRKAVEAVNAGVTAVVAATVASTAGN